MWIVRIVLLIAVVVALVVLALQNSAFLVNVRLFTLDFQNVRLFWVMFVCSLAGLVIGLLLAALREVKLRLELSRLRKERVTMQQEVEQLRAAPLHDLGDKPAASELPAPRTE